MASAPISSSVVPSGIVPIDVDDDLMRGGRARSSASRSLSTASRSSGMTPAASVTYFAGAGGSGICANDRQSRSARRQQHHDFSHDTPMIRSGAVHETGKTRSRRWYRVRRGVVRRGGRHDRRGRLQHLADRLSGDRHRSLLSLSDRGDDLSPHRQLRCGEGRAAERGAAGGRLRRARRGRRAVERALGDVARRLLHAHEHHRHLRRRHARADAQDPQRRRDARHDHDRRQRSVDSIVAELRRRRRCPVSIWCSASRRCVRIRSTRTPPHRGCAWPCTTSA